MSDSRSIDQEKLIKQDSSSQGYIIIYPINNLSVYGKCDIPVNIPDLICEHYILDYYIFIVDDVATDKIYIHKK